MKTITKNIKWIVPVLICLGILVLLALIFIAATRTLSSLESVLLQIISLAIGSSISIFGGHQLSQRAGRLHAQSAVRRLSTLCDALHSVLYLILDSQKARVNKNYEVLLAQLQGIISGQLSAAIDALKDWSDFAPEDVKKSVQNFESDNTTEENNG